MMCFSRVPSSHDVHHTRGNSSSSSTLPPRGRELRTTLRCVGDNDAVCRCLVPERSAISRARGQFVHLPASHLWVSTLLLANQFPHIAVRIRHSGNRTVYFIDEQDAIASTEPQATTHHVRLEPCTTQSNKYCCATYFFSTRTDLAYCCSVFWK